MNTKLIYIGAGVIGLMLVALGIYFYFRPTVPAQTPNTGSFDVPADNTNGTINTTPETQNNQPITSSGDSSKNKIFQISPGPVVGATFIQVTRPTTTLARYIKQENGHVFDLPVDVPGAVPRSVSNVTIPGGKRAIWLETGNAAIMQYLDSDVVKTVYLGFPVATTSNGSVTLPTRIVFLPDSIVDIAASPDGKSVVYLLKTASGVDGYTAKSDGTGSKKVFSLPLSQVLISWPSQNILLAQTKSMAGVPGMVFSITVTTGVPTPLVYAQGITATANQGFSKVLYQTSDGTSISSYLRDTSKGTTLALSFNPFPEKCIPNSVATSTMYCAAPLSYVSPDYLDLWHLGAFGVADSVFSFNLSNGKSNIIATPGGASGGVKSDILEMALSPNEKYLSFTAKGDRAVWGVRLTQ